MHSPIRSAFAVSLPVHGRPPGQHFSNADTKKPNPGENFVQLRYAYLLAP